MVLTAAQTTAFFEDEAQMAIPHATVIHLQEEGISTVDDLSEFYKNDLNQLADNLRRPGGRVPDPNNPQATIPTPPFIFGMKSQKRLLIACDLVRYHQMCGRPLTVANTRWNNCMKNFDVQWKALTERKKEDEPEVPKVTRSLTVIPWSISFKNFLKRVIGVRNIPLVYLIRSHGATVPQNAPALINNQPYSEEHGSVEDEMIARASFDDPLFKDDNAKLFFFVENAVRGTSYAPSIAPFQNRQDGVGAWRALISQFAGPDKWEAEIRKQDDLLHTRVWKGQSNFSLENFVSQHRNAFVLMSAGANHVEFQLPNEHTRVGYLLEGIQCSDPTLQAAVAAVKNDDGPGGLRNDFERAVVKLLPADPVARRRNQMDTGSGRRRNASAVQAEGEIEINSVSGGKANIGKSGVHLRYHTKEEYKNLNGDQKNELREWRKDNPQESSKKKRKHESPGKGSGKHLTKKAVSSIIATELKKALEDKKAEPTSDDLRTMVGSLFSEHLAALQTDAPEPAHDNRAVLQGILKKARFSGSG